MDHRRKVLWATQLESRHRPADGITQLALWAAWGMPRTDQIIAAAPVQTAARAAVAKFLDFLQTYASLHGADSAIIPFCMSDKTTILIACLKHAFHRICRVSLALISSPVLSRFFTDCHVLVAFQLGATVLVLLSLCLDKGSCGCSDFLDRLWGRSLT
jgi:hypothetical protein